MSKMKIKQIERYKYLIEKTENMRVPAIFYSTDKLISLINKDNSLTQLANIATLPGIEKYALGMPDMHKGYGFPIGGVAAFNTEEGVISPGGVGFDINCGIRVIKTNLIYKDIQKYLNDLGKILYSNVPAGLGSTGKLKFTKKEMKKILRDGVDWTIQKGFGFKGDLESIEENGRMKNADPDYVSSKAIERGKEELGSLGAGNHFLEVDKITKIYDESIAKAFGLFKDQVVVWIHTGSRGLGHQIATDYINLMRNKMEKFHIPLIDKELVSLPITSPEAKAYLKAMSAAANYAWANRQIITHFVRLSFSNLLGVLPKNLGMELLYDVAHNIAKFEKYRINGNEKLLLVHRKGATRAFPPKCKELSRKYVETGQPVLLPGSMKVGSYILVGAENSINETFGSVAHGAGRVMSRHKALKQISFEKVIREMQENKIILMARDKRIVREEAPNAYKDVDEVIKPILYYRLANLVAKSEPLIVIKG